MCKHDAFWTVLLRSVCLGVLAVIVAGCSHDTRPPRTSKELLATRERFDAEYDAEFRFNIGRNVERMKAKYDDYAAHRTNSPPVFNMLIISGGGDWGAFGAGFLKGWGKVQGPLARPNFDAVTGVSTGALIAPFAFLGDDASIDTIDQFYRNPQKDWVQSRNIFSFLFSGGGSFAHIPGLEHNVAQAFDARMIERLADTGGDGRVLAINTTNIDTGEMRVFDLVIESRRVRRTGDIDRIHRIILASAAIPGAFPPRLINNTLYVDGGVTGNILIGGPHAVRDNETFLARWKAAYPDLPVPKIRYWILFNNELRSPPEVVQPSWFTVLMKTATTSTHAATLNSMRQLFLQAEIAHLRYGADVEVRIAAIPDGYVPPKPGNFVKESMNALADIGEKMGADPNCWRTQSP